MKKLIVSCATVLIVCIQIVSMQTVSSHASIAEVEAFVTRFYQQCLNRQPDQPGLDYWTNALLAGTFTGADVANGFVFSTEFTNLNTSNTDYLTVLYRAFFDRDPDPGGFDYWLSELNSGGSREDVLDGFIYAQEFYNLCYIYGISPNLVSSFVERFYLQCLSRPPDLAGLSYWVNALLDGSQTGADVANGFVFSPEFMSLNTSNVDYLTVLYWAFFNRNPDPGGYDYWLSQLYNGVSRAVVLAGFIYAQEFEDLCASYGIMPYTPPGSGCADFTGAWDTTDLIANADCAGGTDTYYEVMTITQQNCSITVVDSWGDVSNGTVVGDVASWTYLDPDFNLLTINYTVTAYPAVSAFSGSTTWTLENFCSGTSQFSGVRLN